MAPCLYYGKTIRHWWPAPCGHALPGCPDPLPPSMGAMPLAMLTAMGCCASPSRGIKGGEAPPAGDPPPVPFLAPDSQEPFFEYLLDVRFFQRAPGKLLRYAQGSLRPDAQRFYDARPRWWLLECGVYNSPAHPLEAVVQRG